jgi:hypothetical protein
LVESTTSRGSNIATYIHRRLTGVVNLHSAGHRDRQGYKHEFHAMSPGPFSQCSRLGTKFENEYYQKNISPLKYFPRRDLLRTREDPRSVGTVRPALQCRFRPLHYCGFLMDEQTSGSTVSSSVTSQNASHSLNALFCYNTVRINCDTRLGCLWTRLKPRQWSCA